MDDGTPICLKIPICSDTGSAIFDFAVTGSEVFGSWNALIAICNSGVIYSLRCLLKSGNTLNQGCIKPIRIIVIDCSLLNPSPEVAVCAGNVLAFQRLVDIIFKAFVVIAASYVCMSNFTFGINDDGGFGYYETIFVLPKFSHRPGKGGAGQSCGREYFGTHGDVVVRDVESRIPMTVSILSETRTPYGMNGGEDVKRGLN
ncbi:5-oxoprolinase-like protein [Cadophora sp. MPI-SDFR-AT-0126]|nr:5-oxoprolinase-like protein [Leotiomycetes sp. MPI-SDFR-AT-0126]